MLNHREHGQSQDIQTKRFSYLCKELLTICAMANQWDNDERIWSSCKCSDLRLEGLPICTPAVLTGTVVVFLGSPLNKPRSSKLDHFRFLGHYFWFSIQLSCHAIARELLVTQICRFVTMVKNSMVWVRERTIPTDRPPLVGEVIANLCG
jgi:hypothetical protein